MLVFLVLAASLTLSPQQGGLLAIKPARYQEEEEHLPNLKLYRGRVELG